MRKDAPVSLLREQAEYLLEKTKGVVSAVVTSTSLGNGSDDVVHTFRLVVPALDNYKYALFEVVSGIAPYPVSIYWGDEELLVENREDLEKHLVRIFNDSGTVEIIANLIQIATDENA